MCWYHVTFDLDFEHTLDAGLPGGHCVRVWSRSGHLPARRSDLCKKFTYGRSGGQKMDDGRRRRAIALAHGMSLQILWAYL